MTRNRLIALAALMGVFGVAVAAESFTYRNASGATLLTFTDPACTTGYELNSGVVTCAVQAVPGKVPSCTITPTSTTMNSAAEGTTAMPTLTAHCANATTYAWTRTLDAGSPESVGTNAATLSDTTPAPVASTSVYTYSVTGTSATDLVGATGSASVTLLPPGYVTSCAISFTAGSSSVTQNTTVTMLATCPNATAYQWYTGGCQGGASINGATSATYTADTSTVGTTNYCVFGSNPPTDPTVGKSATQSVTVTTSAPPPVGACTITDSTSADVTGGSVVLASGGSETLTGSCVNATSYTWHTGSASGTTVGSSASKTVSSAATYYVVGTNSGGTTSNAYVTVTVQSSGGVTVPPNTAVITNAGKILTQTGQSEATAPAYTLGVPFGSAFDALSSTSSYCGVNVTAQGVTVDANTKAYAFSNDFAAPAIGQITLAASSYAGSSVAKNIWVSADTTATFAAAPTACRLSNASTSGRIYWTATAGSTGAAPATASTALVNGITRAACYLPVGQTVYLNVTSTTGAQASYLITNQRITQ